MGIPAVKNILLAILSATYFGIPVVDLFGVAAVRNKNSVTYVKFGEQFCIGDIQGACRLLEDKSFQVNLKSLVS